MIHVVELDLWLLRLVEDVNAWDRVCNHFDVSIVVDIVIGDVGASLGIWNRVIPRLEGRLFFSLRIQIVLFACLRLRYEDQVGSLAQRDAVGRSLPLVSMLSTQYSTACLSAVFHQSLLAVYVRG